jgi:ABC-type uncharacterized transport system fused permease/ATPase subunit
MKTKQKLEMLEGLKKDRPQLIRELRAAHDRFLQGNNNLATILSALIFVHELDQRIAEWDAVIMKSSKLLKAVEKIRRKAKRSHRNANRKYKQESR